MNKENVDNYSRNQNEDFDGMMKSLNDFTSILNEMPKKRIRKRIAWWILMREFKYGRITYDKAWEIFNEKYYGKKVMR